MTNYVSLISYDTESSEIDYIAISKKQYTRSYHDIHSNWLLLTNNNTVNLESLSDHIREVNSEEDFLDTFTEKEEMYKTVFEKEIFYFELV